MLHDGAKNQYVPIEKLSRGGNEIHWMLAFHLTGSRGAGRITRRLFAYREEFNGTLLDITLRRKPSIKSYVLNLDAANGVLVLLFT